MYLLDTNIWLERLLQQTRAAEVSQLIAAVDSSELAISDFSLHSIGVILGRSRKLALLDQFNADLFRHGRVRELHVVAADLPAVTAVMQAQGLDFDDAYQYVLARRDGLALVSFDTDFDRTDLPRQTPAQILAALTSPDPKTENP